MKTSINIFAVLTISMIALNAQAGKVHDHQRMKGHVGSANSEESSEGGAVSTMEATKDSKKIHDHKRKKGYVGSDKGSETGTAKRCEQSGTEPGDDCIIEKKTERVHDHRKMKNLN